jgi:methyl-accepting chemotaxis protein
MFALSLFSIGSISIVLLIRSRSAITDLAYKYPATITKESSAEITNFLETCWYTAETTSQIMKQYPSMFVVNIDKLNSFIENQGENVCQSSSAIEEIAANINSDNSNSANNAGNVKSLKAASEIGRTGLQKVALDIQEIACDSEGL